MRSRIPDGADTFRAASEREPAHVGLVRLFLQKEESARTEEARTDKILDGVKEDDKEDEAPEATEEEEKNKSEEERIDETVAKRERDLQHW